jgi:hypothetical protein
MPDSSSLELLNHFTAEELVSKLVHLEQFKQENHP